jgi:hypothetical protein
VNTATDDEVGDLCEMNTSETVPAGFGSNPNAFLPTLGGSEAAGTLFTQLINGHPYYLQSEWSNGAAACAMRPLAGMIRPRFRVAPAGGLAVTFNPAASTSTRGYSSATWSFGDGSHTAFFSGHATLSGAAHRYHRPGTYAVTLTLVDTQGNLKTTTRRVIVHPQRN